MINISNKQSGCQTMSRSINSRFSTMSNGPKTMSLSNGFTAIELLITLFIAAMFLTSGFQLYSVVIKSGGETRVQANASNIMYEYLQRYKNTTSDLCTSQTPVTNQPVTVTGSASSTVTVVITCPYGITSPISKVSVSVKYGNPQQTVSEATFIKPQSIVNDGLIMNLNAGNIKSLKGRRSVINWDSWTVGTGAVTGYALNGDGNSRVIDTNPWGNADIVWDVSNQDAASDEDGGWQGTSFSIDNTKMYRFTTWVRRKTIGNGAFYLGTSGGGASVLNRSAGAVDGNPYFSATGWWGNVNQWYLVVGYVWPAGSGTGAAMPDSGIFALDGTKVVSNSDFVWQPATTTSNHRSYLFYSTDMTTNQQWYQPRVDVVDGTEPSLTDLLNNTGNTWYDISNNNNNGTLLNGATLLSNNGGAINFDGVNDYVKINGPIINTSGPFTVAAWINLSTFVSNDRGSIIISNYNGGYKGFILNVNQSGYPTFGVGRYSDTTTGSAQAVDLITINNWYYIVGTYDGVGPKIYTNGNLEKSGSYSPVEPENANTFIGGGQWGSSSPLAQVTGKISQAVIYNRALSQAEIQQNFYALRGRYGI